FVWFAEFDAGKIGRFDPRTETFKEFTLPGPKATPYALGIDRERKVWYSSEYMDVIGRLDPDTGKVTEYPIPRAENSMRDFFLDDKGRMWFGSPANDRVGYFYVAKWLTKAARGWVSRHFPVLVLRGHTRLRAAVSKDGRIFGVAPSVPVAILRDALQSARADCNAPQDEVLRAIPERERESGLVPRRSTFLLP